MTKIIDSTNLGYLISKIKAAFWSKSETTEVSIDDTPTSNSNNLVKSGGVYTAINAKYTKPSTGIPESDIASGVIPDAVEANPTVPSGTTPTSLTGVKVGSSYYSIDGAVSDVTVGGSSVVNNNGVAVIPSIPGAPGTLNTNNSDAQTVSSSEALTGTIKLHKVSKTGSYDDLLNKPTIPSIPDVTGKADKVTSATNGHLAGLDSNGNLTDSGMGIDNIPTANSNNVVKSGGIYNAIIHPQLAYKLFDNPFSSTSTWTVHCFMNMRSSGWSKIYTIRFRIKAWIPNVSNSTAISDVTLQIYRGVVKAYYIKNAIANTDYRPYYDLYFYGATETGYNAGASDFVGIRINSSAYSYTTQRNYEIQVINADECTFSIFDNDKNSTEAKGDYSASANYNSGTTFNTYTNGLQETSDANTTYSIISNDELRTGTATSSRTVSAARLAANYNISTDSDTGISTIRIGANTISPEVVSNKVTSLSSSSTDAEYPSAKCVYDAIPSAPGTLNTNNSSAQTVNSSEALSGTIKLHKIAKTGTYSDLIGAPSASSSDPVMNGTASAGSSTNYARADHVHPTDTSCVRVVEQSLTDMEKTQARYNQGLYCEGTFPCVINGADTSTILAAVNTDDCILVSSDGSSTTYLYRLSNAENIDSLWDITYIDVDQYGTFAMNEIYASQWPDWTYAYIPNTDIKFFIVNEQTSIYDNNYEYWIADVPRGVWYIVTDYGNNCQPLFNSIHYTGYTVANKIEKKFLDLDIVSSLSSSNTNSQIPSAKITYDSIHPAVLSIVGTGFQPNVEYKLGTLTGTKTFSLATPNDANITNHYFWSFETGSTVPTIIWSFQGIAWVGDFAPAIRANKHYEISVLNNVGVWMETEIPS